MHHCSRSTDSTTGRHARGLALSALAACTLLTACAPHVRSVSFNGVHDPRPDTHPIRIYSTRPPECPYDELGMVHARQAVLAVGTPMEAILDALRTRARRMGGDAIVGLAQAVNTETGASAGPTLRASEGLSGTVIRFTRPDCDRE